ncbi:MAG: LytTR family DNA-binding domain-containing protein [Bacteroidota bacterium]
MSIPCIIIDDEPLAIQVIEGHIKQIPDLEHLGSFQNPLKAFEFLRSTEIELIFLDIQMPFISGIDFVESLNTHPKVIFTTAHRKYALESYELEVVDYLLKPISFSRFFKAINKFKNLYQANPETFWEPHSPSPLVHDHIYVNSNKKFIKVAFDQILYIESLKDYVRICTAEKKIITKGKISEFGKRLTPAFMRIHRSFIVNTQKITAFNAVQIEIGSKVISIGRAYRDDVIQSLKGS